MEKCHNFYFFECGLILSHYSGQYGPLVHPAISKKSIDVRTDAFSKKNSTWFPLSFWIQYTTASKIYLLTWPHSQMCTDPLVKGVDSTANILCLISCFKLVWCAHKVLFVRSLCSLYFLQIPTYFLAHGYTQIVKS